MSGSPGVICHVVTNSMLHGLLWCCIRPTKDTANPGLQDKCFSTAMLRREVQAMRDRGEYAPNLVHRATERAK